MHASPFTEFFTASPQSGLRIVRLDHHMSEQLATDTEHRRVEYSLFRGLPHITREAYYKHYVYRRLMIADYNARRRKCFTRDVTELQVAKGQSLHQAARHPACNASQPIIGCAPG